MARKRAGRSRGGNGALCRRGGKWTGVYRVYDSNGKAFKREFVIGPISDLSQEQARAILTERVHKLMAQERTVRIIGPGSPIAAANAARIADCPGFSAARTGTMAELAVCLDLISKGWEVFRSVSQVASCDLLALKDGQVSRVEVKYTSARSDQQTRRIDLRRNIGRFDILAVVFADGAVAYGAHDTISDFLRPKLSVRDVPEEQKANELFAVELIEN